MNRDVYENCRKFLKKYPGTIAWRVKKHASVIQRHINDDEVVLYTFIGQKDTMLIQPFFTTVIVFTNKRMLLGRKKYLGRSFYTSITPDMLNDFEIRTGLFFGSIEIDTVKEHFIINGLSKKSLGEIEDAISKYLINEKIKILKNRKETNE
ncbi:MAG: PH domain-containing protein [Tenericutes bacterium]|nr:PH domain-containing protein [Mycoplasmatota bacterium]